MITEKSVEQALALASIAGNKSLFIIPVENTPLFDLVKYSAGSHIVGQNAEFRDEVDFTTEVSPNGVSIATDNESHNASFDATVDFLSKVVATHVNNAKNVIAPVVLNVARSIIKNMEMDAPKIDTFNIIQVNLPAPMINDGFRTIIEKAAGGINAAPETLMSLGDRAPQQILSLMSTGSTEYDEKIAEWFSSKGDVFFEVLWSNLFKDKTQATRDFMDLVNDNLEGVDYALGVFLLARKLLDDVQENSGMTLTDYERTLSQYFDVAANKLNAEYQIAEANAKNGMLIVSIDLNKKDIYVNSKTYLDYIANGGKNEVLFGAIASNIIPYNVSKLSGNEQLFAETWERVSQLDKASTVNKAFVRFKQICHSAFLAELETKSDIEQAFIQEHPGHEQTMTEAVSQVVDTLDIEDMKRPYDVALKMVCKGRFYYTEAESLLSTINRICEQDKGVDPREAALIATTEYLIDYLSDQMKLA